MGSIHQIIGAGPHGFQKQALGGDRFEDRVIVRRGQRMLPPGFLVAAGEHLVVAFQKQDFIVAALALEVVKAVEQVVEQFTAPHIHNDGDFGQLVLRLHAQLREFGQELPEACYPRSKNRYPRAHPRRGIYPHRTDRSQ